MTDQSGAQGFHSQVTLVRFNLGDDSITNTSVAMNGDAFNRGAVVLDRFGKVWIGWGQTLARFDPASGATQSWSTPSYAGVTHTDLSPSDGRMVAMTVATDGSIWVGLQGVKGLFQFDSNAQQWNQTLPLPLFPNDTSRITELADGRLAINGTLQPGAPPLRGLALVSASTPSASLLTPRALDYVVLSTGRLAYVDDSTHIGIVDTVAGQMSTFATSLPTAHEPLLTADTAGRVWFSMEAFRSIGVGSLDIASGGLAAHPFPYIANPGSPVPNDCPSAAVHCIPSGAVTDPEVQALVLDSHQNLWVVTGVAGAAPFSLSPSALYELPAGS